MTAEINPSRKLGMATGGGALAEPGEMRRSWQIGDNWATAAVVVAIVLLMQIGSYFVPPYILPSPISVLGSLLERTSGRTPASSCLISPSRCATRPRSVIPAFPPGSQPRCSIA